MSLQPAHSQAPDRPADRHQSQTQGIIWANCSRSADITTLYSTAIDHKSWKRSRLEIPFSGAIVDLCMYTSNTEQFAHEIWAFSLADAPSDNSVKAFQRFACYLVPCLPDDENHGSVEMQSDLLPVCHHRNRCNFLAISHETGKV